MVCWLCRWEGGSGMLVVWVGRGRWCVGCVGGEVDVVCWLCGWGGGGGMLVVWVGRGRWYVGCVGGMRPVVCWLCGWRGGGSMSAWLFSAQNVSQYFFYLLLAVNRSTILS